MHQPEAPGFGTCWRLARVQAKGGCRLRELKRTNRVSVGVQMLCRATRALHSAHLGAHFGVISRRVGGSAWVRRFGVDESLGLLLPLPQQLLRGTVVLDRLA
jgi:hypothetical protein